MSVTFFGMAGFTAIAVFSYNKIRIYEEDEL